MVYHVRSDSADRMRKALELKPIDGSFSLKEHIYGVLKDSIMELDIYDPEAVLRMDERTLADQLGISRTPIREAIMRLEQEGFVEIQPRRGVFIRRKTLAEALEMIEVWAGLESMAARLGCERATEDDLARLKRLGSRYTQGGARAGINEYSEANIEFHLSVLGLSKNALLISTANGLLAHLKAIRRRAMADPERAERSVVDHGDIIAAIEARDPDRAGRLVRDHTLRVHDYLRRSWRFIAGDAAA